MSPSGTGLNIILLSLIQILTKSTTITNFILVLAIYFFPFLSVYILAKEMKATSLVSFLIAFFYVVNPFTLYYLTNLNQGITFSIVVIPLSLWLIIRFYFNNFKLFFFFGLISTCFSFAYTNYPMFAIIQISIVLSVLIANNYRNGKLFLSEAIKKYCLLLISFLFFNAWWMVSLVNILPNIGQVYTYDFAKSWLNTVVVNTGDIIGKTFSLTTGIGADPSQNFFTYWYNQPLIKLITFIPILLILIFFLIRKKNKKEDFLVLEVIMMLIVVLFFLKGSSMPFGVVYNFLFAHLPFFYIFKTPVEKFGILYIFLLTILLLLIFIRLKDQKFYHLVLTVFSIYLFFCSVPILSGNIIPKMYNGMKDGFYASRKYFDKVDYQRFRQTVNEDKSEYRILSLPGSANYQVCLNNQGKSRYTGMDPVLMDINKPFIAPYNDNVSVLYNSISKEGYQKLLGFYSIKKVLLNQDTCPWFGYVHKENINELTVILDRTMVSNFFGPLTLYENKN
ncbi:hypothetical protein COU94_01415 [Candidatus Shapirobacteria bacterium CG10_big_fil_rev_8_21_14_0_10_38_8]|nr:MAG: hypothetical protein COU94_01415 [Candidatus Shapirobacteria bacterium CG10_big_fil_rev_8_21_14_0_10_38_8]